MIWSISWKNVWRNKTRSMVVIVAVMLGLLGGVFSGAVMLGMIKQRIKSAISNEVSHIQIHHPEYFSNKEIKYTFSTKNIIANLENNKLVKAYAPRTKIVAMANTSSAGTGVIAYGIIPELEKQTTEIYKRILPNAGTYFNEKKSKTPSILISANLAKKLKLLRYKLDSNSFANLKEQNIDTEIIDSLKKIENKRFRKEDDFKQAIIDLIGVNYSNKYATIITNSAIEYKLRSKIILNFANTEKNLVQSAFKISGIYKTSNAMFDELSVFIKKSDLDKLAIIPSNQAHEIAILTTDFKASEFLAKTLKTMFSDLSVQQWSDLQPDLKMTTEYMNMSFYILTIFILFALAFGIINTMLMAILERIKELGMLMAVGMNKKRVFTMIMLESVFLTFIGGIIGIIISTILVLILNRTGIDLQSLYGQGLESVGYSAIIYPEISMKYLLGTSVLVILTGIVSSIYPARKAIHLNPAEAVRTDN